MYRCPPWTGMVPLPHTSSKTLFTSEWWEKQQDLHPQRQTPPCPQIPAWAKAIYQNYRWDGTSVRGSGNSGYLFGQPPVSQCPIPNLCSLYLTFQRIAMTLSSRETSSLCRYNKKPEKTNARPHPAGWVARAWERLRHTDADFFRLLSQRIWKHLMITGSLQSAGPGPAEKQHAPQTHTVHRKLPQISPQAGQRVGQGEPGWQEGHTNLQTVFAKLLQK